MAEIIDDSLKELLKNRVIGFHTQRGRFLNAYAQIEFLLLDIISKVQPLIQYSRIVNQFPRSTVARLKMIKSILLTDGPLNEYDSTLRKVTNLLSDNAEIRHFLAHGFSKITFTTSGTIGVDLSRFNPLKKDPWEPDKLLFPYEEFELMVSNIVESASVILGECRLLYDQLNFEGEEPLGEFQNLESI